MKRCNGVPLLLPPEAVAFHWDARARWSQESKSVETMALKYHWRGLIGTVCFCNLCILDTAD